MPIILKLRHRKDRRNNMRRLKYICFLIIITILIVRQVNFVHGEEEAKNDLGKSIDELKKVLEHEPSNIEGHYYLGLAYYDKGMVSEAVDEFNKILELDQNYINAYFYLGTIYTNQGNIDKAIDIFKKLQVDETNAMAEYNLGLLYNKKRVNRRCNYGF